MSIKITQIENKWFIEVQDEKWVFESRKDLDTELNHLLLIKEQKGKLNRRE